MRVTKKKKERWRVDDEIELHNETTNAYTNVRYAIALCFV